MNIASRVTSFAILKSDEQTVRALCSNPSIRDLLTQMGLGANSSVFVELMIEIDSFQTICVPLDVGLRDAFGGKIPTELVSRRINKI